jgi:sugar phosphate isomerase/epimerase
MQLGFLTDGRVADVEFAAREGFECLELALFGDTPLFEDHRPFKQALEEREIVLAAVSLFGQNYFHPDPAERRKLADRLQKVIDLTAALARRWWSPPAAHRPAPGRRSSAGPRQIRCVPSSRRPNQKV